MQGQRETDAMHVRGLSPNMIGEVCSMVSVPERHVGIIARSVRCAFGDARSGRV